MPTCRFGSGSGTSPSNDGEYFTPRAPLYFIKGNNEDFDVLARAVNGTPIAPALHYMPNGGPYIVGPVARRGARRHLRAELV